MRKFSTSWKIIIVVILIGGIFLLKEKPWVPRGYDSADKVMAWCNKNDSDIYMLSAYGALDQGVSEGSADPSEYNIILRANKKSNTYVFKVKSHYVYVVKIIDPADGSYWEQAVGLSKDNNGKVFHRALTKSEMDSVDEIAVDDTSWNDYGFNREFRSDVD
ncbi:hypothetical protein LASUN_10560 [Lentilactobacillus sunkii]|uniref:Uncharacterized protein n=1 Tax=Lentilactobacillus sunkii TaxID=481719 RepID=A0A1E7XEC4_9LACO|nr:hypothetical protein [Lentilactobacillus sunkii]OFA11447.1 hypothetical protein LASUN_10560 [Lentilactobacillus sunkii]